MRSRNDRRKVQPARDGWYGEYGREPPTVERRKGRDRRKENLRFEERLLLLGEMPSIDPDHGSR